VADEPRVPVGWSWRLLLSESRPQATQQALSRRGPGHGEVLGVGHDDQPGSHGRSSRSSPLLLPVRQGPSCMNARGRRLNVLVAGETWIKQAIHIREFDQFHIIEYEKGAGAFLECLVAAGHAVTYVRGHDFCIPLRNWTRSMLSSYLASARTHFFFWTRHSCVQRSRQIGLGLWPTMWAAAGVSS